MKKFTTAEVFFVITGFEVPKGVLTKNMGSRTYANILMDLANETILTHQEDRIRQECKNWLVKNFPHLLTWDLGEDLWKQKGMIECFIEKYANVKFSYFEIEPIPSLLHLSLDVAEEMRLIEIKMVLKKRLLKKIRELKSPT